jgi:hypothetical protein
VLVVVEVVVVVVACGLVVGVVTVVVRESVREVDDSTVEVGEEADAEISLVASKSGVRGRSETWASATLTACQANPVTRAVETTHPIANQTRRMRP